MITTKTLADILTASRFGLAWVLLWLGISRGPAGLPTAVVILIIAWITDVLDGPIARKDASRRHTWIGDHDLETDVSVSLGVLTFLVLAGYLAAWLAVGYVIICLVLLWRFRSQELAWAVQAPPYGAMLYFSLCYAPAYGFAMVAYLIVVLIGTWPRFPRVTLPQFFSGIQNLPNTEIPPEKPQENTLIENSNNSSHA
jgi:phosphatidylglycerophosphate synthase